jgi:hypothetical protein
MVLIAVVGSIRSEKGDNIADDGDAARIGVFLGLHRIAYLLRVLVVLALAVLAFAVVAGERSGGKLARGESCCVLWWGCVL